MDPRIGWWQRSVTGRSCLGLTRCLGGEHGEEVDLQETKKLTSKMNDSKLDFLPREQTNSRELLVDTVYAQTRIEAESFSSRISQKVKFLAFYRSL
jgi:hypothetical protein